MATIELLLGYAPLLLATALALPVALVPVSPRARLLVSRVALPIFGGHVDESPATRRRQRSRMRAAFVGESHRVFASRTLLIAAVAGVVGSVYGVYVAAAILRALAVDPAAIRAFLPGPLGFLASVVRVPNLSAIQLFALLAVSSATIGAGLGAGAYWGQWAYLDQRARSRAIEIDASLPRTVAFVYALSRSGMPFQAVLRTLSRNQDVYGEAARELDVAVRDMDAFGTDILTALQDAAERTPSENLEEFAENLASVLSSGQSVSAFLRDQYERFQEEAESQQRQYLELLSTFAEVYVTVLVAGPLFFITVLVVVGLVLQDTLALVRVVTYLAIPLATFGFVVYVDSMTENLAVPGQSAGGEDRVRPGANARDGARGVTDGGAVGDRARATVTGTGTGAGTETGAEAADGSGAVDPGGPAGRTGATGPASPASERDAANRERLAVYDRFASIRRTLADPVETVLRKPAYSLALTGPLGLLVVWLTADGAGTALDALLTGTAEPTAALLTLVEVVDGPIAAATILAFAGFALAHEARKRRLRSIDAEMPDFLDRMASINEAGVSVVGCLKRLAGAELGRLGDEVERARRDVRWGSSVDEALARMERRTGTPTVSRATTLIRNAMAASGDISPVLAIAADEAQEARRLRRERRQEMLTYLVVIYVSFLVFLGIVAALTVAFIPAIEAASQSAGGATGDVAGVDAGFLGGLQSVDTDAYELLFFHAASIQAVCSGLVAGQLGEGDVADGAKHAAVLLTVAYVAFAFL